MSGPSWRIWISEDAIAAVEAAAAAAHPRETGGVLIGVLTHGSRPWVTHALELRSPKATSSYYEVPAGARREAVDELKHLDRRLGYLGDWHAHPADAPPSSVDTATITRLGADPDAGCARPVLLVARRTGSGYDLDANQLSHGKLRSLRIIRSGPLAPGEDGASLKPKSPSRRRLRLYLRPR